MLYLQWVYQIFRGQEQRQSNYDLFAGHVEMVSDKGMTGQYFDRRNESGRHMNTHGKRR